MTDIKQWLEQGISAAKAGRRQEAQRLLIKVIEADEGIESAWLWLSGVVDSDQDRLVCLENVLTLNPDNAQARAGLDWLQERGVVSDQVYPVEDESAKERLFVEEESPSPTSPSPPSDYIETDWSADHGSGARHRSPTAKQTQPDQPTFLGPGGCVYCGYAVEERSKHCPRCGQRLSYSEFTRDKVSPTTTLAMTVCAPLGLLNIAEWYLIDLVWQTDVPSLSSYLQRWAKRLAGPTVYDPGSFQGGLGLTAGDVVQIVRFVHVILAVLFFLGMVGLLLRLPKGHTVALVASVLQIAISVGGLALGIWAPIITFVRAIFAGVLAVLLFQALEDFDKKHYRLTLEIDRRLVNATDYYSRGREYQQQGMWAKALIHWRRAAALSPLRDTFHVAVARAYYNLDCYEDALKSIEQAIQISREPAELEPMRQRILEARQHLT